MRLLAHETDRPPVPPWQPTQGLPQIGAQLAPLQVAVGHLALYPARGGRPAGVVYQTELEALRRRFELAQAQRRHLTRADLQRALPPLQQALRPGTGSGRDLWLLMEGRVSLHLLARGWSWTLQLEAGDWVALPSRLLHQLDAPPSLRADARLDLLHWHRPALTEQPAPVPVPAFSAPATASEARTLPYEWARVPVCA